jgi:hypothetical protein
MKKKMLFMAAIAGLVTLGSCVKDDVSSTVEAVRQAKANELNAKANKDNAEADLIKATQAAKVAQEQAKALQEAATARIQEANAKLKEDALAQELESIIADFKAKVATSNADVQTQLNNLQNALRAAATAKYDDIAALIANYRTAFNNFTKANAALVTAKANLEKAKIDSDYAEEVNATIIKGLEDKIAEKGALLEALKEVKATNPTKADIDSKADAIEAQADEDAAAFENNPAIAEFLDAAAAWGEAYAAYDEYVDATDGVIAELNKKVDGIDPGKEYLTKETNPSATIAPLAGKQFADYQDYDIKLGASNPDKFGPMGTIKANGYRVSEEGQMIIDNYLKTYTKTQETALKNETDAKKDLEAQLGKETDKKDTKWKNTKGEEQGVTLYGALAGAQENLDKAKKAEADAKADLSGKPAAVETAYKALLTIVEKAAYADKQKDWTNAVLTLANAVIAAYGEPAHDPNLKTYDPANATHRNQVVELLYGVAGKVEADLDDASEVKALFDDTSANKIVASWKDDATKKDATEITKVKSVLNRKSGEKSVIEKYTDAANALGKADDAPGTATAYGVFNAAKKAIADQPQKIAAAQDAINAAQEKLNNAEADKKEVTDLVAAVADYSKVVKALQDASAAYNKAYEAVENAADAVNSLYDQAAEIRATTPQDIDNKIAAATAALAKAKSDLAKAKTDNHSTDDALATAEKAVLDAEADLLLATAELEAAKADIENSGIEFDLSDDEEPAPAEDPTPAPETPVEEAPVGE